MENDPITKNVRALYEEYNFPAHPEDKSYDAHFFDPLFSSEVLQKMKNSVVLDAGCGTGPNIFPLSKSSKEVFAFDLSENSVKKARSVIERFNLKNVTLTRGNIFELPFDRKFDFIFSIGVLHHTKNSKEAFRILADHLNSGGYITLALYNTWGSWRYRILMRMFNLIKDEKKRISFIKKYCRIYRGAHPEDAYVADSYIHPRVTFLSVDDVLQWFKENNIEFVSLSKPIRFRDMISHIKHRDEKDYKKIYKNLGSSVKRIISQTIWGIHHYQGYFTIIGRKK